MEELTKTEERIMQVIWALKQCFINDIVAQLTEDPKPPYNTVASIVRLLEQKGYVGHKVYGRIHEFYPLIEKEVYRKHTFKKMLSNYFDNSAQQLLSFMVKEEKVSNHEIEALKRMIDDNLEDN